MKPILTTDKIYISDSKMQGAGRGVFAKSAIRKGELIEKCPVIPIPQHDVASLSEGILLTYFYFFGKKKERMMVALGFGSIYNHTDSPNARYKEQYAETAIDFIALREIKKDEEITVNYAQGKKRTYPLWFEIAYP